MTKPENTMDTRLKLTIPTEKIEAAAWEQINAALSASILAESGMPPWQVQLILRHRNITTTQGYVHSLTGVRADMDAALMGAR